LIGNELGRRERALSRPAAFPIKTTMRCFDPIEVSLRRVSLRWVVSSSSQTAQRVTELRFSIASDAAERRVGRWAVRPSWPVRLAHRHHPYRLRLRSALNVHKQFSEAVLRRR
jgi:hypothetical protein